MRSRLVFTLPSAAGALFLAAAAHAQPPIDPAHVAAASYDADAPVLSMDEIAAKFDPAPNGITSEEVVRRALEHSPELKKAQLSENTAAANQARAKLAFAPRLDFTGKFTHVSYVKQPNFFGGIIETIGNVFDIQPVVAVPKSGFPQVLNQWYTQASVSLPITDIFLTVIPTYKSTKLLATVAEQRVRASELQVSYDARVAYYNYAHVIGAVVIARDAARLLEASVRDLEALVQAGAATETDLMRTRAELAGVRATEVELVGMVEVALARLAAITGTQFDAKRGIGERFVGIAVEATPDAATLTTHAQKVRPELVALRKLQQARDQLAQARRGQQAPKLSAFGNGYYANPHPRVVPQTQQWRGSGDVGVMLSWSPNDTVYAHTQYNDALTDLASVGEDLRLLEDGIVVEVAQAVTSHSAAAASIDSTTQKLEAARRYQLDQRALLLAGAATPNDLLLAQNQLTRAALEWVDAFISIRLAQAALLKARGDTGISNKGPIAAGGSTP